MPVLRFMNINHALQQLSNASGVMESAIYDFYRKAMEIASECPTAEEKKAIWVDAKEYFLDTIATAEKASKEIDKKISPTPPQTPPPRPG